MKRRVRAITAAGLALGAAFPLGSCRARDFGEKTANSGSKFDAPGSSPFMPGTSFDPRRARGRDIRTFRAVGLARESCVLPRPFPGIAYAPSDAATEEALCRLDFHGTRTVLCPRVDGTFPAVELHVRAPVPTGVPDAGGQCVGVDALSRVARLEPGVSCAFPGAVLGAYHLTRILGAHGLAPVAVARTLDTREFEPVAAGGQASSVPGSLQNLLWRRLQESNFGRTGSHAVDGTLFGALVALPGGFERYSALNVSASDGALARLRFFATPEAARVLDAREVGILAPRDLSMAAPILQQMRDVSDLVVLDHLLQQQDRFGNLYSQESWAWIDAQGRYAIAAMPRGPSGEVIARKPHPEAVPLRRMVILEHACARPGNPSAFTLDDIARLRHMSPETYARLRYLAATFRSGLAQRWFADETLLDTQPALGAEAGAAGLGRRVVAAAEVLERRCRSGELLLDLDVSAHLARRNLPHRIGGLCDGIHAPVAEGMEHALRAPLPIDSALALHAAVLAPAQSAIGSAGDGESAQGTASSGRTCRVVVRSARVRAAPDAGAEVVAGVTKDMRVALEGPAAKGWLRVRVEGASESAYVSNRVVEKACRSPGG